MRQKYPVLYSSNVFMGIIFVFCGVTVLIVQLFWNSHSVREKDVFVQLREGEGYLQQNSKESAREALGIFNRVLARSYRLDVNQQAKYGMAMALERLGENEAALKHYRELYQEKIEKQEIRDRVDYALGRFYLYLNHEVEGRSLLDALLRRVKDKKLKSSVFATFGLYYLRRNENKRAEENFKVALKYNRENLEAEEGRAQAMKKQGRDWAAYQYYDDYLSTTSHLNPSKRKVLADQVEKDVFDSGIEAYHHRRYHNAISFFQKVRAKAKDKKLEEKSRFWIAESYRALSLNQKAIQAYERVLGNSVQDYDAASLFRKGAILFQCGRLKEAGKTFARLNNSFPQSEYNEKAKEYLEELHQDTMDKVNLENHGIRIEQKRIQRDAQKNTPKDTSNDTSQNAAPPTGNPPPDNAPN